MNTLGEVTHISRELVRAKKAWDAAPFDTEEWDEAQKAYAGIAILAQQKGIKVRKVLLEAGLIKRYERLPRIN